VIAEKDKETVGYEVTLHFENLEGNIEKDLADITRLVETHPDLLTGLPDSVRVLIE